MASLTRRAFLESLGISTFMLGTGMTGDGVAGSALVWGDLDEPVEFGPLEDLASMMQTLGADDLQRQLIDKLESGTTPVTLAAAAALANARTFAGEDYVGYHVMMAILPAMEMAPFLPKKEGVLPLLKVIHRNARRIQEFGGRGKERLREVTPRSYEGPSLETKLVEAERNLELRESLSLLSGQVTRDPLAAFDAMQAVVRENIDVHQVVLAWRAWDMIRIVGEEHADTMLIQALRQCVDREKNRLHKGRKAPAIRSQLPKAMMQCRGEIRNESLASQDQVDALAWRMVREGKEEALFEAAQALQEGFGLKDIHEAATLASVRLLLHDPGRQRGSGDKPKGSVHGASIGIHAADSANAWRHIVEVCEPDNALANTLTVAWHTAGQSGSFDTERPFHAKYRAEVERVSSKDLLGQIEGAVKDGDQGRAAALTELYGESVGNANQLAKKLVVPMVQQDGALHHEKFFHTSLEEFYRARPAWRWQWMVALARVAASGQGFPAPGVQTARSELG